MLGISHALKTWRLHCSYLIVSYERLQGRLHRLSRSANSQHYEGGRHWCQHVCTIQKHVAFVSQRSHLGLVYAVGFLCFRLKAGTMLRCMLGSHDSNSNDNKSN